MAIATLGLFILIMTHVLCQCFVQCTGYYNHVLLKHKKFDPHYWTKYQHSVMKGPVHKFPYKKIHVTSYPIAGYHSYQKGAHMFPPKLSKPSFTGVVPKIGTTSQWWNVAGLVGLNPPTINENKDLNSKRNPKYLWLQFSDKNKGKPYDTVYSSGRKMDGSVTRGDVPGDNVPKEMNINTGEVKVVTIEPNQPTGGFGPNLPGGINGFKTGPDGHDILKSPNAQSDGNLPSDVIAYNGNLPSDFVSIDGILQDSINSLPIQLDKIVPIGTTVPLSSGDGKKQEIAIVGSNPSSNLLDAPLNTADLLLKTVSAMDGDLSVTSTGDVSLEGGEFSNTLEFEGSEKLPFGNDLSADLSDSSSKQSDLMVTLADPIRVQKVHQPLAKPLELMLRVEPFGPGPYGTCREPSKVVCGARFGWDHVLGMAAWCQQNCVVYMYTSYCDDDRCQCDCE